MALKSSTKKANTIKLRENYETATLGKKIWQKEIFLDKKTKPFKTLLHKHLAFFSEFVELTEGKKVQIRITSEENLILLELFSFNKAIQTLIEKKYYEYVSYTLAETNDTTKFSFSEKIDLVSRIIAEGSIGFEKGIFKAQKERIEELKKDKIGLMELARVLAKKLPNESLIQPNLTLNIGQNSGNINLGNFNQVIDNKIEKLLQNEPKNLDLKQLLAEISNLKKELLESENIEEEDKKEALEYMQEIIDNLENKDQEDNFKLIKKAGRGLLSIITQAGATVATEYLKKQLGL